MWKSSERKTKYEIHKMKKAQYAGQSTLFFQVALTNP